MKKNIFILSVILLTMIINANVIANNNPINTFSKQIGKNISTAPITNDNVEAVCKNFIKNCSPDIDVNNLKLLSAQYRRNQWYVSFTQTYNGIQILNSEIKIRLFKNGNLMDISATEYFQLLKNEIERKNIDTNAMKIAAVASICENKFRKNEENLQKSDACIFTFGEQFILPIQNSEATHCLSRGLYRLVQQIEFHNKLGDVHYICYIDVENNAVLRRHNLVHNYEYQVKSKIVEIEPNSPLVETTYFPYVNVDVEGKIYSADVNGVITSNDDLNGKIASIKFDSRNDSTIPPMTTLTTKFYNLGDEMEINENDFELSNSTTTSNNTISNADNVLLNRIAATHYHSFYKMNDKFKEIDPDFDYLDKYYTINYWVYTGNEGRMPNAMSGFNSIIVMHPLHPTFQLGQMPSVLYHELGHSINSYIYNKAGSTSQLGMENAALQEGTADVHSAIMLGSHDVFIGLHPNYEPDAMDRDLKNTLKMGYDDTGEEHADGRIIAGAIWDFGELTSLDLMAELFHFTRFAKPDAEYLETGKAFTNWFIEMLLTDDDDGTLTNLTPHWDELVTAFDNHNIGFDGFMQFHFVHTPLENTDNTNYPYSVTLTIPRINNFRKVNDVWLHYAINGGQYDSVKMNRNGDVYTSSIPAQSKGTIVNYYFRVNSPFSNKYFALAPYSKTYTFYVNWDIVYLDHKDNSNKPELISPNSVKWKYTDVGYHFLIFSPNKDHGGDHWAWQLRSNIYGDDAIILDYSDLVYPEFNISNKCKVLVDLYYWVFNTYGDENTSAGLVFQISRDGGQTWIDVAKKAYYEDPYYEEWTNFYFVVNDYFDTFSNFKLRIRAEGESSEWAEYATFAGYIDDVRILVDDIKNGIEEEEEINTTLYPNPADDFIMLETENIGEQIEIISIDGKHICSATIDNFQYKLDISYLPKAAYHIVNSKGKSVGKFVKR